MYSSTNVLEYNISPYDTRFVGLTAQQSAKILTAGAQNLMSNPIEYDQESVRVKQYNDARRLDCMIRKQNELLSQLYLDELCFERKLGRFAKQFNEAYYNAWFRQVHRGNT